MKPAYLKKIPDDWGVRKGKRLFYKEARPVRENDEIITAFRDGEVTLRKKRREIGFTNASLEIGYQGVRINDLVIHEMDGFAGAIGVSDSDGKCSPIYSICTPKNNENVFFYCYFLRELARNGFIQSLAKGVRERSTDFRYKEFSEVLLPVPPLSIQNRIADFLNEKTAAIDKYIKARKEMFNLFQEHTETLLFKGGIDNTGKRKKSGIFWLPEIPETWTTDKAKRLFADISIKNYPDETILSATQDKGVIPRSDNDDSVVMPSGDRSNYKLVEIDDFVISLRSFQGGIEYSAYRGLVSPAYTVLKAKTEIGTSFYKYLFKTSYFISALNTIITGIRDGKNINYSDFAELILPVPPLEEQKRIGEILDKQQELIHLYQKEITFLHEYRTRLISDAVFGKIIN